MVDLLFFVCSSSALLTQTRCQVCLQSQMFSQMDVLMTSSFGKDLVYQQDSSWFAGF